jgi:hypothetical protein
MSKGPLAIIYYRKTKKPKFDSLLYKGGGQL